MEVEEGVGEAQGEKFRMKLSVQSQNMMVRIRTAINREKLWDKVLHGNARTTEAVRRAIQKSETSLRALAEHYDINPKTVVKWKKRRLVGNTPMGSKVVRSSVLSIE